MIFYWTINWYNWNFIWNIILNNGIYWDLRNKSICLNTVLVVKKKKAHKQKSRTAGQANTQPFSEYFSVRMRFILILFCVYILGYEEPKSTISYVLLTMNMISISNCEYEYWFHDIKRSIILFYSFFLILVADHRLAPCERIPSYLIIF